MQTFFAIALRGTKMTNVYNSISAMITRAMAIYNSSVSNKQDASSLSALTLRYVEITTISCNSWSKIAPHWAPPKKNPAPKSANFDKSDSLLINRIVLTTLYRRPAISSNQRIGILRTIQNQNFRTSWHFSTLFIPMAAETPKV